MHNNDEFQFQYTEPHQSLGPNKEHKCSGGHQLDPNLTEWAELNSQKPCWDYGWKTIVWGQGSKTVKRA